MAKQIGVIKIQGTIEDLTFKKTQDGYMVSKKSAVNKSRISTGASFLRTRENMAEFAEATRAGKVLRRSMSALLRSAKDSRLTSRLMKAMHDVIKSDSTSARGSRSVSNGNVELLKGFDFNANAHFSATVTAPFSNVIDRSSGVIKTNIPAFVPTDMIKAPQGATHYKIVSGGAVLNFATETSTVDIQESAVLPWDNKLTADLNLVNTLPVDVSEPIFQLLGIQFFQQINGEYYSLSNGTFNALNLAGVLKA
ncbi:MAG TPA: hypothetical protein VNS32_18165 [Flavisolibacter sp.]|nr:hypothetical protein [Flavisolibacter sp.]